MELSIIIPLYNEECHIGIVIERLQKIELPTFVSRHEIVIVDDCSTDQSHSIISEISKTTDNIKILKHHVNKGKGAAVRYGIENSTGDVIIIQDADLELHPRDIPSMLIAMHELNVGFVNGSRYLAGINRPLSSFSRYLGNKVFTLLTAIIINVKISDMACGYKLFERKLYNKLKLKENRFGFEAELIVKALKIDKNNIAEVPVHYFPRKKNEGKKIRNSDAFKILWKIVKYGLLRF